MDESGGTEEFVEPSELLRRAEAAEDTSRLTLRGAVVRCKKGDPGRLEILLRDTDYRTSRTVEVDASKPAVWVKRGMQIEVPGALTDFEKRKNDPLSARRVWKGRAEPRLRGYARGFEERAACADRVREQVRRKGQAQLRGCRTLYVVTSQRSDGRDDIEWELGALEKLDARSPLRARPPKIRGCNLYDPGNIARVMEELLPEVCADDIVLAARGGGEWLDNFEDVRVIAALGELAMRCATFVAVGHARNELKLLEGIVLKRFTTPSVAVHYLNRMLSNLSRGDQRPGVVAAEMELGKERPRSVVRPATIAAARSEPSATPTWNFAATDAQEVADSRAQSDGPSWSEPRTYARAPAQPLPRTTRSPVPLIAVAILSAAGVLALGLYVASLVRSAVITSLHAARVADPRGWTPERTDPDPEPSDRAQRGAAAQNAKDQEHKHASAAMGAALAPVITPAASAAPGVAHRSSQAVERPSAHAEPSRARRNAAERTPKDREHDNAPAALPALLAPATQPRAATLAAGHQPAQLAQDPTADAATTAALRTVARLLAPFDLGCAPEALRARCAASYGMWLGDSCRLPGGREVRFGLSGGLVQTLTVRQVGSAPVPLLSSPELAFLQVLSASGRGPFLLNFQPWQLTVQPRPRRPGF